MQIAYSEVLRTASGPSCPRRTIVPPNRLETRNRELISSLARTGGAIERLRNGLRQLTGREYVYFAPSARCAIAQVLSALDCREVVMPAFTCPVVKQAVEIAGKQVVFVDIQKNGLNATSVEFGPAAKPGRVLIPTHLFGIPTDIERISELARQQDCLTIEDAAAAFGATINGRALGTFGDVGIFSFERSKRVPAFRGAAIIVNNENLAERIRQSGLAFVRSRHATPLFDIARAILYNLASYPPMYGRVVLPVILRRYASAEAGIEESAEEPLKSAFYAREFVPYQAALAQQSLKRLSAILAHVAALVGIYRGILTGSAVETFTPRSGDDGGLLRFPIAFTGAKRVDALRHALMRGLYLETNFERPLPAERQWGEFPNSCWAADHLVLLPLYSRLSLQGASTIAASVKAIQEDLLQSKKAELRRSEASGTSG